MGEKKTKTDYRLWHITGQKEIVNSQLQLIPQTSEVTFTHKNYEKLSVTLIYSSDFTSMSELSVALMC